MLGLASELNRTHGVADRLTIVAHPSTAPTPIINVYAAAESMKSLSTTTLDATVVNARRRFRRVLVGWATDLVALAARNGRVVRWSADAHSPGE